MIQRVLLLIALCSSPFPALSRAYGAEVYAEFVCAAEGKVSAQTTAIPFSRTTPSHQMRLSIPAHGNSLPVPALRLRFAEDLCNNLDEENLQLQLQIHIPNQLYHTLKIDECCNQVNKKCVRLRPPNGQSWDIATVEIQLDRRDSEQFVDLVFTAEYSLENVPVTLTAYCSSEEMNFEVQTSQTLVPVPVYQQSIAQYRVVAPSGYVCQPADAPWCRRGARRFRTRSR